MPRELNRLLLVDGEDYPGNHHHHGEQHKGIHVLKLSLQGRFQEIDDHITHHKGDEKLGGDKGTDERDACFAQINVQGDYHVFGRHPTHHKKHHQPANANDHAQGNGKAHVVEKGARHVVEVSAKDHVAKKDGVGYHVAPHEKQLEMAAAFAGIDVDHLKPDAEKHGHHDADKKYQHHRFERPFEVGLIDIEAVWRHRAAHIIEYFGHPHRHQVDQQNDKQIGQHEVSQGIDRNNQVFPQA